MILIPLRQVCKTSSDVASLIERIFQDIRDRKELSGFEVAQEMQRGKNGAITDALILQPNFSGLGINFNYIINFLRGRRS